jgi:hypothetical protein
VKDSLRKTLGVLVLIGAVAGTIGFMIGLIALTESCEHNRPERRAERHLGSGAVCGDLDDGAIPCVMRGVEYICMFRGAIACAARTR